MLKRNGVSSEDPEKPKLEAKYKQCVQKALASGLTQEDIDA